jgi:hypothetical protein
MKTRTRKLIAFLFALTIIIPFVIMLTNPEAVDDMMDGIKIGRTQTAMASTAISEAIVQLTMATPMPPRWVRILGTVTNARTCASMNCPSIGYLPINGLIEVDGRVDGDEVDGSNLWYRTHSNRRGVDAFVHSTWIVEADFLSPTPPPP